MVERIRVDRVCEITSLSKRQVQGMELEDQR